MVSGSDTQAQLQRGPVLNEARGGKGCFYCISVRRTGQEDRIPVSDVGINLNPLRIGGGRGGEWRAESQEQDGGRGVPRYFRGRRGYDEILYFAPSWSRRLCIWAECYEEHCNLDEISLDIREEV